MTDDDLRAEIVALRNRLADLESRLDEPSPEARTVSRRGLLAAAVAGGAGLVATQVTTAAPAVAAPGNAVVLGAINDGGGQITTVRSETGLNSSPFAVVNDNTNGASIGFYAQLGQQSLVFDGGAGQRAAVMGDAQRDTGVAGFSVDGYAVYAKSRNNAAVKAESVEYTAVRAESTKFYGVYAASYSTDYPAVLATSPCGPGLEASAGGSAPAVEATSAKGYGVVAKGARAPLRLVPSSKVGKPTTGNHVLGELYVDKAGALYLCTAAGAPGTWRKVALV